MPYGEHRRVRAFDLISSYTGQLRWGQIVVYVRPERVLQQFGYLQMVPPPSVCDSLTGDDIDDWWLNFPDHLVPSGELCVVPGQVATDYMEWFFRISHSFVTWTEETAASRHPPPPHHEEFVEPPIPKVSVATDLRTHSVVSITSVVFHNLNFFKCDTDFVILTVIGSVRRMSGDGSGFRSDC